MGRRRVRNPTVTCDASASKQSASDEICDIDIEVKVGGVDLKGLSSVGKVFRANGREHSMSCFGSWVFRGTSASNQAKQVCIDGGIIASLTWGLLLSCPKAEIWVKNVEGCCFTIQLSTDQKLWMSEYIAKGNLAKDLEHKLRQRIPHIYKQIRIRLTEILGGSEPGSEKEKKASGKKFQSRTCVAKDFERISKSMQLQNYELAYAGLKRMMESKIEISERVHVLIRLGICCLFLKKSEEVEDTVKSLLQLTENLEDCSPPLDSFNHDIDCFTNQLKAAELFLYSVNVCLFANKVIRKIEDPEDRLNGLHHNVVLCAAAMMSALSKRPMIKIRTKFKYYLKELENEKQYMKTMKGCDKLKQSRVVYYTLHILNDLKARLGEPVSKNAGGLSVMRFSCAESSWADFLRITSLASQDKEIAPWFSDNSFLMLVREISDNPALLEKRYGDPRIRRVNTLLNQNHFKATPMSGFTRKGLKFGVDLLKDRKEKARKEKERGDDAFDKMDFENALRHYNKAIEIDPSDALHHCDKAKVFIRLNKLDEATKSCSTAMRMVQSEDITADIKVVAKVFARYADVEYFNKRFDSAMEWYQTSLSFDDDVGVREQMSVCLSAFMQSMMLGDLFNF